jgi:hypothetical protein
MIATRVEKGISMERIRTKKELVGDRKPVSFSVEGDQ